MKIPREYLVITARILRETESRDEFSIVRKQYIFSRFLKVTQYSLLNFPRENGSLRENFFSRVFLREILIVEYLLVKS